LSEVIPVTGKFIRDFTLTYVTLTAQIELLKSDF